MTSKVEHKALRISDENSNILISVKSGFGQPSDTIASVDGKRVFQEFNSFENRVLGPAKDLKGAEISIHTMVQDRNDNSDRFDIEIRVKESAGSGKAKMIYKAEASGSGETVLLDLVILCI